MIKLNVDESNKKIKLVTDEAVIRHFLEVITKKTEYIPWQRKVGTITRVHRIYDERKTPTMKNGVFTYTLGYGWAAYLLNTFSSRISQEDYHNILNKVVYSDSYIRFPFPGLREDQNEDVLHLLKFKRGLYSVYTGYGLAKFAALNVKNRVISVKAVKYELSSYALIPR
jgi:hypothetical protein